MYPCIFCEQVFSNKGAVGKHKISCKNNPDKVFPVGGAKKGSIPWNKGKTRQTDERLNYTGTESFRLSCKNNALKNNPMKNAAARLNLSNAMKKAHAEGRAWNIGKSRWNNTPSYPEKFFMCVITNEFEDKQVFREFPIGIYSADFCWPDKLKVIEIDGEQHDRFEEIKKRDERKDKYLKNLGYSVLRIKWKEMCNNTKLEIEKAYKFIHE